MTPVFADTFVFLAILNRDDASHSRAVAVMDRLRSPLVTTAWVITELADAMCLPRSGSTFVSFESKLRADARVTIVPCDPVMFDAGLDLYRRRSDKEWALTDCISFVVMRRYTMTDALTGDNHFEQAGFIALLK